MSASKLPLAVFALALACSGSRGGAPDTAAASEKSAEPAPASGLPDRDPALAKRLVEQEDALLLDVRTAEEFAEGHVEGAVQIPHDELAQRVGEVVERQGGDKHKPIVVYCRSGRRADTAKQILLENGFDRVTNLGGVSDWPGE